MTSFFRSQKYYFVVSLFFLLLLTSVQVATAESAIGADAWFTVTPLPIAVAAGNAVVKDNFVYLIGGRNSVGDPVDTVYRTQAVSGVAIKPEWSTVRPLPRPLYAHASVATADYIYVIGGWDGSTARNEILSAQFTSDGNLGGWNKISTFPTKIQVHDAVIVKDYIYVLGGANNTQALNTVYYAKIQADGKLGAWAATSQLPRDLYRLSVAAYGNYIYIVGGYDGSKAHAEIYRAQADANNGALGSWTQVATLNNARYYNATVVRKGQLIILGGRDTSTAFNDVLSAPINADGTLGAIISLPSLPEARYRFAAALGNLGQIYVLGGLDSANTYRSEVSMLAGPPSASCGLSAKPAGWLAPGMVATYTVTCRAGAQWEIKNLVATHQIPDGVELVAGSGNGCTLNGQQITCNFPQVAPNQIVSGFYQVKRPDITPPAIPTPSASGLQIVKSGPYSVSAGQLVTYTLVVTNSNDSPISGTFQLTDVLPIGQVITASLPATTTGNISDAKLIHFAVQPPPDSAGSAPQTHTVVWTLPALTLAKNDTITARVALIAPAQTLINKDYNVRSTDSMYSATGSLSVTTYAGPAKDELIVASQLSWQFEGQDKRQTEHFVLNSPFTIYLPAIINNQ